MLIHEVYFADIAANSNICRKDIYIEEQLVFHMECVVNINFLYFNMYYYVV